MDWFNDWHPMTTEEINMLRMKAYLNFDEQDIVEQSKPPYETYYYKNKLGKDVICRVLIRRKNGEIVKQQKK